tara:strand:+ start:4394 stop:6415 length:2022 start_codon:yes stop_codon:yes gene_type:complete
LGFNRKLESHFSVIVFRHVIFLLLLHVSCVTAEVVRVEVEARENVAGGISYGLAGAYEKLTGKIYYEIDPENSVNKNIIDLGFAPVNERNLVEFSADFYILKPVRIEAGNGALFLDVMNRGRKRILYYFNGSETSNNPQTALDMGDGFLLRHGYTILYVGWQFDVPDREHLMRVYTQIPSQNGEPIQGLVRSDFTVDQLTLDHSLGDREHAPYSVANPDDIRNMLTVRDRAAGERILIPRDEWHFARSEDGRLVSDKTRVSLIGGFEPNRIYEVVFVSENPPVAGLGLAAMRDVVSQLKYDSLEELGIPAEAINRALAFGDSQAGRYLRTYLYDGFNQDEFSRKVFDGMIIHTGSNARGGFNHRFAQPSRAVDANYFHPGDQFPFSDVVQTDPLTGIEDSLFGSVSERTIPKIFYTNSSTEYWRLPTALIHTNVSGTEDVDPAESSRIYLFSGTQHVPGKLPETRLSGQQIGNPNDYKWFLRSLLLKLDDWVQNLGLPPKSQYPLVSEQTLVSLEAFQFPDIPRSAVPLEVSRAYRLDYGAEFESLGIIAQEPPKSMGIFPFLVPQVNQDGNELAGLRSPFLSVPLATYTGWNPYSPNSSQGSLVPFSRTHEERRIDGDPRLSIAERYSGREEYLGLFAIEAIDLVKDGYLLNDDLPVILEQAGTYWDHFVDE